MEFFGFIFTKEDEIRDFFNPYGYKINNDFAINSENIKKYKIKDKWIFFSNYEYLRTVKLKKYIKRSKKFARIIYSEDQQILKFDYLENGRFKNQIILVEGEIKSIRGYADHFEYVPIKDLFQKLIEHHFELNPDFIHPEPKHFVNENKQEFKLKPLDFIYANFYFRGAIKLALFPILFILLVQVFMESLQDGTLQSAPTAIYLLFISYLGFAIYLLWEIIGEIKHHLSIKNQVLNDDKIALPKNNLNK